MTRYELSIRLKVLAEDMEVTAHHMKYYGGLCKKQVSRGNDLATAANHVDAWSKDMQKQLQDDAKKRTI